MKTAISLAALVLGGLVIIGCDDKKTSTVSTPDGTSTTVTTPSGTSTTTDNSASNKMSNAANNAGDAIKNGADDVKAGAQRLGDKLSATTMPSMNK